MNAPNPTNGDDAALSNLMGAALGTPETSRPAGAQDAKPAAALPYGAPAEVANRIEQYVGHYGRENTTTLLLCEAVKALRAPASTVVQGDAQDGRKPWECAFETWWEDHGQYCRAGGGQYERSFAYCAYEAALASRPAPAAGDAQELLDALKEARRELHSCQAVIHLAGGFDPAYVRGAQAALKRADAAIAAQQGKGGE